MPATTQPPAATSFGFGTTDAAKTAFSWKPKVESASSGAEEKSNPQAGEQTSFSSPKKAEFEFKPRSPRRISSGQGDESDGESLFYLYHCLLVGFCGQKLDCE